MRRRGHLTQDSLNKWIPAKNLKKGEHLKTLDGRSAVAESGSTPADRDGWLWDLTIQDDHDFYVEPAIGVSGEGVETPVLVHNCDLNDPSNVLSQISMKARMDNGVSPFQNVAVYRIGGGDDARYLAAASDSGAGLHSEEILNNYIDDAVNGLSRDDVTGIYSERIPCMSAGHACMERMPGFGNAQDDISFSLNPDSSKYAKYQNAGIIGHAMGGYQGETAGLPDYECVTP